MSEDGRIRLRRAMDLHSAGDIDAAIAEAEAAIRLSPDLADAHSYLGNTLVARQRRFADGLAALDRASELAPGDPGILYTLGWCREFVANAIERRRGGQPVSQSPADLYAAGTEVLLRALECDPEPGLRADIEDILDVIAAATGIPWSDD